MRLFLEMAFKYLSPSSWTKVRAYQKNAHSYSCEATRGGWSCNDFGVSIVQKENQQHHMMISDFERT